MPDVDERGMKKEHLGRSDRHILRLLLRDADAGGWARVSSALWPSVQALPADLVEMRADADGGGEVRLTEGGRAVARYV